jgi:ATPase subunit of ABC transporter with duplicated ATPase domains
MLTVSQLSKSFAGRALFEDVSPQVNRCDRIGLVGPNGAGKSTLFVLLQDRPPLGISNGADTISLLNTTTGSIWSNRRV